MTYQIMIIEMTERGEDHLKDQRDLLLPLDLHQDTDIDHHMTRRDQIDREDRDLQTREVIHLVVMTATEIEWIRNNQLKRKKKSSQKHNH